MSRRAPWRALGVAGVLAVLAWWWWPSAPPSAGAAAIGLSAATARPPSEGPGDEATPVKLVAHAIDGNAQLIDEVEVSSARPCVGEPVTVATRLRSSAAPRDVEVKVGLQDGQQVVITSDHPGQRELIVRARQGGEVDVRTVTLEVRACEGVAQLNVNPLGIGPDRYGFIAELSCPGGCAQRGVRYRWDFGDGETLTSEAPFAEHDYTARPQRSSSSSFIVRVEAMTERGLLRGATSISLDNLSYRNRQRGYVTPTVVAQRAQWRSGRFEVPLRFYSHELDELQFDHAEVTLQPCDEASAPTTRVVPASTLLTDTTLPSGPSERVATVTADEAMCGATVNLFGEGAGGRLTARFGAQLRQPPAALTGQQSLQTKAGADPEVKATLARVRKAMVALGRDPDAPGAYVSAKEIDLLRLRGALH